MTGATAHRRLLRMWFSAHLSSLQSDLGKPALNRAEQHALSPPAPPLLLGLQGPTVPPGPPVTLDDAHHLACWSCIA